ncbi:Gfo/Idh/MocA family oxidoreductase [Rhizobium leguminosarum bv. viciae]|uniref:Gfo/Idh/MocA family oxidoreductase n=2 Tax=Rhizobium leguminosarum TaxID=384 RepID=A0A8G2MQA0_RHILV|nr:gfo/Idh/MocA family oxidoreductase [Rhizobium leguminosarum bv. viciae]TBX86656.1 Gfo/Idh/MocA family oxidoreductase [Rhizobium leguminosarum bv. viciae]TBZ11612.1 Gfo/Idh/MocA family oxidoreductase [Rhizobium leguminosarum bv. viciae]
MTPPTAVSSAFRELQTVSIGNPHRIRLGMIGGGQGAFIGGVHRIAARLDNRYELVAGALSSNAEKALSSGRDLGLANDRCYASFEEMAARESAREDGIEVVAIVTPNHMHFGPARTFLEAGFHVICDKPVTTTLDEARALAGIIERSGRLFVLTHNYTGYPMIRQMRDMVTAGALGKLRHVQVEYAQDWLTEAAKSTGAKGAEWRTDPSRSGAGGSIGDIGTHAFNLAAFVTGETPNRLLADLTSFVPGRKLDDSANILLRYASGAKGMLWASQVAVGNENTLTLRVYGDKAGIEWAHATINQMSYTPYGEPTRIITRNGAGSGPSAARVSRVPAGHPEGYLGGFATIYREAADAIMAVRTGAKLASDVIYPGIREGIAGLAFIEAAVRSNAASSWETLNL